MQFMVLICTEIFYFILFQLEFGEDFVIAGLKYEHIVLR
jgi:hypothetical protein